MRKKYNNDNDRLKAIRDYQWKYKKDKLTAFTFRFRNVEDELIIWKLKNVNATNYVRQLILNDLGVDSGKVEQ